MAKLKARIFALSLLFPVVVVAQTQSPQARMTGLSPEQVRSMQAEQVALNIAMAPIKSRAELFTYIHSMPSAISPLYKLSPGARERFLGSLTFNENGITGFSYEDLKNELTASDIYKILSLFGAQHNVNLIKGVRVQSALDQVVAAQPMLMEDHEGYSCTGRANCTVRMMNICMSGC